MKKLASLLLALGLLTALAACAKAPSVTMEDIYKAGLADTMLADHRSFSFRYTQDGVVTEDHRTRDYIYQSTPEWESLVTPEAYYCRMEGACVRYLPVTPTGLGDMGDIFAQQYAVAFSGQDATKEVIDLVEEQDGIITVHTHVPTQRIPELSYRAEDTLSVKGIYRLDKETGLLTGAESVVIRKDGTREELLADVTYDGPMPQGLQNLLSYARQEDNLRTVTLVTGAVSQSVRLPKGMSLQLYSLSGEERTFEAYADEACTQPWSAPTDYVSDSTVYVKWSE